jgi:hypothetical protein
MNLLSLECIYEALDPDQRRFIENSGNWSDVIVLILGIYYWFTMVLNSSEELLLRIKKIGGDDEGLFWMTDF